MQSANPNANLDYQQRPAEQERADLEVGWRQHRITKTRIDLIEFDLIRRVSSGKLAAQYRALFLEVSEALHYWQARADYVTTTELKGVKDYGN